MKHGYYSKLKITLKPKANLTCNLSRSLSLREENSFIEENYRNLP
jgi:hypothetical protein